jgi:hypothetical protein
MVIRDIYKPAELCFIGLFQEISKKVSRVLDDRTMRRRGDHVRTVISNECTRHLGAVFRIPRDTRLLKRQGNKQQTPWPLIRKRTIPTERPPSVGEI